MFVIQWLVYYPKLVQGGVIGRRSKCDERSTVHHFSYALTNLLPKVSELLSYGELPIRERESSLRLLSKGWAGFTGQVNHLGKVTKDLWTAVLHQIKWVALLNFSLNNFFLRIVYSVITSCYFTRCKFYHNSCSMVQKCKVDKKQHPARAPCENHLMQIMLANSEANRRVTLRH